MKFIEPSDFWEFYDPSFDEEETIKEEEFNDYYDRFIFDKEPA